MTGVDSPHVRAVRASEVVLTQNEKEWLVFWRAITAGRDPAPTLRRVQLVRRFARLWEGTRNATARGARNGS